MGKKAEFPMQLLESSVNKINQGYIDEFVAVLKETNLADKTKNDYIMAYDRIFRYKDNWAVDFRDYTNETINKFIEVMVENDISRVRINTYITALNKISIYHESKYPDIFHRDFLKKIPKEKADKKNVPSRALTLYELNELKKFLIKDGNERLEYTFKVFYYTGNKKSDHKILAPKNAKMQFHPKTGNFMSGYFELNNQKVEINEDIWNALKKIRNLKKFTLNMIDYYFELMTEFMQQRKFYLDGQTFTYDDIKKTRDKYFIKCPYCNSMFENKVDNWIVVNIQDSKDYYIVCKKHEEQGNG